ncbi:hypothetical protein LZS85_15710 [Aliivibrio fischeri]|uniref:hypothetical protein n=1 Tax=Aliivibrio fischeri TaxID=668 RepID=UPI001F2C268D|nr:hypothetical protein [Aliivibrio fischeri]MCE7567570.1 hypothetical protein [Aliivibrio fischeri]
MTTENKTENKTGFERIKELLSDDRGVIILSLNHDGSAIEPSNVIGLEVAQSVFASEEKEFLYSFTRHMDEMLKEIMPTMSKEAAKRALADVTDNDDVCVCGCCNKETTLEERENARNALIESLTDIEAAFANGKLEKLTPLEATQKIREVLETRKGAVPEGIFTKLKQLEERMKQEQKTNAKKQTESESAN